VTSDALTDLGAPILHLIQFADRLPPAEPNDAFLWGQAAG
jgi:hypothetical protein